MKITVKKDIRNLKKGTKYDFSKIKDNGYLALVGDNGCGKSTIVQALRGYKNDLRTSSLYERDFIELSENFKFEHDYEKIFHLDRVKDDGQNMNVSYDASEYLKSGGYQARQLSHGQSSMNYFNAFLLKIRDKVVKGKTLVVFDEVDSGFSISYMSRYRTAIRALMLEYEFDMLVISHNPFFIIESNTVFDISKNEIVNSADFIKEKTFYKIELDISPINSDE